MESHKASLLGSTALSAALVFSASTVCAQQSSGNGAGEEKEMERIEVTGSRLLRPGSVTPIPVTSITAEDVVLSGVTAIGDLVNELPSMGLGSNRQANLGISAPENFGTNLLNLRFLGTSRTLVVVDGRRHVGSIAGSTAVDVNAIPTALVERVDVSTGGASVAYGADAVSGVINFVLRDDFEGIEADAQYGMSEHGDADDFSISITGGGNFADGRGNAVLSVAYNDVKGVRGPDRDWIREQNVIIPNPDDTGPNDGIPAQIRANNGRISIAPFNSLFVGMAPRDLANNALIIDDSGTLRPFDPGTQTGGSFDIGGDGLNIGDVTTLSNPLERISIDGRFSYELQKNVRFFLEGKYYGVEATNMGQPTGDFISKSDGSLFLIAPDNPFAPNGDPLFDQLVADNAGFVVLSRFHRDLGIRTAKIDRDTIRLVAGFDGDIPGIDANYEVYYQYGEANQTRLDLNNRDNRRFILATDVTTDVAGVLGTPGAPACRSTLDAGGVPTGDPAIDDCVPLNVFGAVGAASQEAIDFIELDLVSTGKLSQHVVNASVAGTVFDLPAGPISVSGGFEYRKETSSTQPDTAFVQGIPFDGDTMPVSGAYDVIEGFFEARVPILAGVPFVELLAVEGGVRLSDYNTVGSTTAWRASAEWSPVEDIRFRGGYARSVRAPNISELFAPQEGGFSHITDPCDKDNVNLGPDPARRLANCTALLAPFGLDPLTFDDPLASVTNSTLIGGNPDMTEETAKSITAGAVLTPRWTPGFVLAVDFFDIEITDAIASPGIPQIVTNCVDRFDSVDNEFCALFSRSSQPAELGAIQDVVAIQRNIAALEVRGVDFEASYAFDLEDVGLGDGNAGSINLRVVSTYLDKMRTLPESEAASFDEDAGEVSSPHWRFNLQTAYNNGPFTFNWLMRYIGGGVLDVQDPKPQEAADPFRNGAGTVHDIQARYIFDIGNRGDRVELFFGINDLLDKTPPILSRGTNSPISRQFYDPIGRFFYGGVRIRL